MLAAGLLDLGEMHALGDGFDDLVEQVHDLGPRALQLADHLHARDQPFALVLETFDFLDLLVELADLVLQDRVAIALVVDPAFHHPLRGEGQRSRGQGGGDQRGDELFLALLAQRRAVRQ